MSVSTGEPVPAVPAWHAGFLRILPAIRRYCRAAFADMSADGQEEAIAEVTAAALVSYVSMFRRGRAHLAFPNTMARFAILRVRNGRKVAGTSLRDVSSQAARQHHGVKMRRLDGRPAAWKEAVLEDTRRASVSDTVAFRLDFAEWLKRLTPRNRAIAQLLALRYSTNEVARKFRLSASRISRMRRELCQSWKRFQGESPSDNSTATRAA